MKVIEVIQHQSRAYINILPQYYFTITMGPHHYSHAWLSLAFEWATSTFKTRPYCS